MNIGGLSGTTSNTIRGFGGLASGLDRDSLIEGMTAGTTAKINKQQQKKTLLQWEQTAIRNITDKLTSFADKYTSTYASGTNLFSSSLWGRNKITALGANSKYVSVSGSANTADTLEIQRIKQLAKKAQLTSSNRVSDSTLQTGDIDLLEKQKSENLEGKTLTFNYGDKEYSVTLPTGQDKDGKEYKYDTVENVVDSLNRAFKDVEVSGGKNLSEIITVEKDGNDKIKFTDKKPNGTTLKFTGGSAAEYLGFTKKDYDNNFIEIDFTGKSTTSNETITDAKLFTETPFIDRIAGKSLTFNYNGTSKTIKMPTKEELEKAQQDGNLSERLKNSMQTQLNEAFGQGRIKVDFVNQNGSPTTGRFTFKTMRLESADDGKDEDESSVLILSSADAGMLGENGAFKTTYGESNRVNLNSTLAESGLTGAGELAKWFDTNKDKKFAFTIDDGIKEVKIEISKEDTMQDIMNRINEETNVQVTYQSSTDKFVFTSKKEGASGSFELKAESGQENILKGIFGTHTTNKAQGTDAILQVKYAGSDEVVEIVRDSNTFKVDGMTITLNGTFGYKVDENGKMVEDAAEAITFDAKVDDEKIVETIKEMIKEYNEIIELVNKEAKTKPSRDYAPLTDEQKKELSESEIEAWEEKAKEGLLFNDNDIKGLSNGLRFVLGSGDLQELEKIGISVSSTASDNGKLSFDESKFKAALASDPEGVKELFTKEQVTDETGNIVQTSGIATNMKKVLDKYAKTVGEPKGILINRAGSIKSPASITQNELYKQILEVDKRISSLQDTLKMEQDRYIRQFTTLESLIAQMNSQSSALSQFGGGF